MNLMWWCTLPQPQISSCPAPPLLEFGISLGLPVRIRLTSREPGLTKQVEDDLRGLWPSGLVYTLVHGYYKYRVAILVHRSSPGLPKEKNSLDLSCRGLWGICSLKN